MAKQNTPGLGIEYEVHIPAYFALLLNNNEDVEDFKLRSNVEEFGNLDDLLIDIKTKNGKELYFAFQLKHKENYNKSLLPTNFEARGDFNLEKYCEAFKNMSEENRKYHFVLYTTKNFDCTRKEEVTKFRMEHDDRCEGKRFFNTSPDFKNVYKFEIGDDTEDGKNVTKEDYQLFFSQFTLYTGQINFNDLNKSHILDILKYEEQFLKYVNFFRRWHRGEFLNKIVDKETLNVHLIDIFLAPFVIKNYHLSNGEENLELFESILRIFDLTIIDDSKANFIDNLFEYEILEYENRTSTHFKKQLQKYMKMYKIDRQKLTDNPKKATEECLLRLGKEIKMIDRYTKELKNDTKLKLFYYFFQKPLIIDFNETSKELIHQATQLYKMSVNKIKFVFLGQEIDVKKFQNFQIFENLKDLLICNEDFYKNLVRRCALSLQGRSKISLKHLIESYREIADFTKPKEIFQMLKDEYTIGDKREELPQYYVPRTVSTFVFDIETILDHCAKTTDLTIVHFGGKFGNFRNVIEEKQINVILIQNYLKQADFVQNSIIVTQEECSRKQFVEMQKSNQHRILHYLKLVDEDHFLLVMSSQNTFRSKNFKLSKIAVEEQNIAASFNSPINIFCASPGMGKSTLLSSLKNLLPSEFWVLRVDLKVYNTHLKEQRGGEEFLHHLMQIDDAKTDPFVKKIKSVYLRRAKILLLMDGLDEIESICVENILECTEQLAEMGYRVWLSSRRNLQQKLEAHVNIFAIDIDELSKEQQKQYVLNKLQQKYEEEELEAIATKIFSSTDIINNQPVLGVPLQLHIITEIFLSDRQNQMVLEGDVFILTKMFKIFFEGRYEHSVGKMGHQNLSEIEDYLQNYEIAALQSLFDNYIIDKLDLDLRKNRRFLDKIKKENDPLGIIVNVNGESRAVFQHFTFGEYFAAAFLVNNFNRTRILKKLLFSDRYENLLLIFNTMMAEHNPLHLAIIHKDINQIKRLISEGKATKIDEGGRNLLHVATCHATKYPLLPCNSNIINDLPVKNFNGETAKFDEIIKYLLTSDADLLSKDRLFDWNPLEYALAFGSLYVAEKILEKVTNLANFEDIVQKYHSDVNTAYYSLRYGYPNLLSALMAKKNFQLKRIDCLSLDNRTISGSILQFSAMSECKNRTEIIDALNGKKGARNKILGKVRRTGINTLTDWRGHTLLHFATLERNEGMIDDLVRKGADINVKASKNFQWTPLHLAALRGDVETMDFLLKKGANINETDKYGESALCVAVRRGCSEGVDFLIGKGAKCNRLSLQDAIIGGNLQIIEKLLDVGVKMDKTALHYAVSSERNDVIELLIGKGVDVNLKMKSGDTILHCAILSKETMEFLLDKFDVNHLMYVANKNGATPLHLAVYEGKVDVVELLLGKEIDLHRVDTKNRNYPLRFAKKNGRLRKELLLKMTRVIRSEREEGNYSTVIDYLKDNQYYFQQYD